MSMHLKWQKKFTDYNDNLSSKYSSM
ncbi:hypothetical protein F383_39138 [Gossypium arboreum]|uniref:Uncharacterized protein n=1 Tax=Gossypium arboreum TaxID=29729 RepID=A0A0B0MJG6_GOSAR|nr:hypothetical protein F383_39138 [Gossypium arboreum]